MCLAGAVPISLDTGLADGAGRGPGDAGRRSGRRCRRPGAAPSPSRTCWPSTRDYLRSLVDLTGIRPLHVVVDAGNGMAGYTVPAVFDGLPLRVEALYFELDGSFPNHEANPLEPANLVDLQQEVRRTGADIGLAFDGDADRCFVIDERGDPVSPSAITAPGGHPGTAPAPRRDHSLQPDLLPRGAGDRHRGRRDADPHQGRAFLHQGRDGRHQRGFRRRAFRALLFRRLLPGRHRHAGRHACAGRPRRPGLAAVGVRRRVRAVRRFRRDQLHRRTTRRAKLARDQGLGGTRTTPRSTSSTG